MAQRLIWISGTMSASVGPPCRRKITSRQAGFMKPCSSGSVAEIISARRYRSFLTLRMKSNAGSWRAPEKSMSRWWRLAARWEISNLSPFLKRSASCAWSWAQSARCFCILPWYRTSALQEKPRPSPLSTRLKSYGQSVSSRTSWSVGQSLKLTNLQGTRLRCSPMSIRHR